MRRGLVIGKFLPIHNGHIALIRFAANQCDELIVSMSYSVHDPIDPALRFFWINEIFKYETFIKPEMLEDNFDDESLSLEDRTKIWAGVIRKRYPRIDVIFSSEEYGDPFAKHLGASHQPFDKERKEIPVSASMIRHDPLQFWDFLPEMVRPYFVKKICFYGPESTGKSTMAKRMAEMYKTEYVPEVAREIISSNNFTEEEIVHIGYAQTERVLTKMQIANRLLFCDTDIITTQIYSRHYLGVIPDILYEMERTITYDKYFLFDIDTPWVADNLRDLSDKREEMFSVFRAELDKRNIMYTLVSGDFLQRELIINNAIHAVFIKDH